MRLFISSFVLFSSWGAVVALDFPPFQSTDSYKCGQYKRGRVEDRALGQFYYGIRQVIGWLSQSFPHQELVNDGALLGDQQEWISSFENKYQQWLQFEEGNIAVLAGVLSIAIAFPIVYILIRCISACCRAVSKEKQALSATEAPWDGCKRHFLNTLLIIFVLIDVFAAASLLVTGQYAQFGLEQLPSRLNQCIDDLSLYKRETDGRIRKLLIDDWRVLNASLVTQMDGSGELVVERVKKVTGAHGIDVFMNVSQEARIIQSVLGEARDQLVRVQEEAAQFSVEFNRLKKSANTEISTCLSRENEQLKAMCRKAATLLEGFDKVDVNVDTSFMDSFDQNAVETFLLTNVSSLLNSSNGQFKTLSDQIQREIDAQTDSAKNVLRKIGDDLFIIAEQASSKIRQVNFDPLYAAVAAYTDNKEVNIVQYVRWSWYASLIITGIFVLLSLAYLFGLFYGLCGRGNSFYNDDCCTRSTGSRFYSCGIWLSIFFFTVLSICAGALFFIFSNTTHLLCDPLERPLSRPDMVTLGDRYINLFTRQQQQQQTDVSKLLADRSLAEVIRGCARNETFYQIFDMDSLYHLNELENHEREALNQLDSTLTSMIDQVNIEERMGNFLPIDLLRQLQTLRDVNVSQLSTSALKKIEDSIQELNLMDKLRSFEESLPNNEGKPQAVAMIIVQVDAIDREYAAPLRERLRVLHANLTKLNSRLGELHIPVDSLLSKLQHAQVLLSEDVRTHVISAAREVIEQLKGNCDDYIKHVKREVQQDLSSCEPIVQTIGDARDAVCEYTIDPINGSWMSMLICLGITIPIIIICTTLITLYNKIMAYPKYSHEPMHDHFVSSFITDNTYDTRRKPVHVLPPGPNYSNYSYAGEYHTPYIR
ncbi:prmn-1 [Pristionchus pacificus]|uniref:Prmn-1 n=1 Tax=Pristionchus pacificus TaxID=54126 RepID=A0A2A6D0Y4_PRIPA|nr:prmn-1 [Pristionchus pacificus]|eukprot:PDM84142.1 prmn-1 [Pristionchus pacificus]